MSQRRLASVSGLTARLSGLVVVQGRIVSDGEGWFVLADGVDSARVHGSIAARVGDLVVIEARTGSRRDRFPAVVQLLEHYPRPPQRTVLPRTESWRLVEQGIGKNLVERARAFETVRRFFRRSRFLEIDPPAIVPSPGLDLHLDAMQVEGGWLMTSPEYQMKRLLAGGLSKIFAVCHVFRKGEMGARHNPEFTMIEWYRAFSGVEPIMTDTERLVRAVVRELTGGSEVRVGDLPVRLDVPFARIGVLECFEKFAGLASHETLRLAEHDEDEYFRLFVERIEPGLSGYDVPVFLHDFPISQASLARAKPSDPSLCERFELYLGGVELSNGFGELVDPVVQRERLLRDQAERRARGKPVYPIDERFLSALAEGVPPSSGNALGFDRLLAICLGEREIGRVMPFPAAWL